MVVPLVITPVTDPDDARLDDYRRLQDHTIRRRLEEAGGFFIVEGWEAVRRLLASGWVTRSLLVTDDKIDRLDDLGGDGDSFPRYCAPREIVAEVIGFDLHRGVIASAERPEPLDWRAVAATASRLAVLEGINDHENLGAIFRSAAALGIEGVLLSPTVPDPLYRRSVRVSMGAVLIVPFARMDSWPQDLADLRAIGLTLIALTSGWFGRIRSIRSRSPPGPPFCWARRRLGFQLTHWLPLMCVCELHKQVSLIR